MIKIVIKIIKRRNKFSHLIFFFSLLLIFFLLSMGNCVVDSKDYRQLMRDFVGSISSYSKTINPNFIVIPQNGVEIIDDSYLSFIDGIGLEDFFYGYEDNDLLTAVSEREYLLTFINKAKNAGKKILIIDYCYTIGKMDDSYEKNNQLGFISFAADHRGLDNIPSYPSQPYNVNSNNIIL